MKIGLKYPILILRDDHTLHINRILVPDLNITLSSFQYTQDQNWRENVSEKIRKVLNKKLARGEPIIYPRKIKDIKHAEQLGPHSHLEKISVHLNMNVGFFEKNLGRIGLISNFISAIGIVLIDFFSFIITINDNQKDENYDRTNGYILGVMITLVAFIMNIVTYNYSEATSTFSTFGRWIDNSKPIRTIGNIYIFKKLNSILDDIGNSLGSLKESLFRREKKLVEDGPSNKQIYCSSTAKMLLKMPPIVVSGGMFCTWITASGIRIYQSSKATMEKSNLLNQEPILAIAWITALTGATSMFTFYGPFIWNWTQHIFRKINEKYPTINTKEIIVQDQNLLVLEDTPLIKNTDIVEEMDDKNVTINSL